MRLRRPPALLETKHSGFWTMPRKDRSNHGCDTADYCASFCCVSIKTYRPAESDPRDKLASCASIREQRSKHRISFRRNYGKFDRQSFSVPNLKVKSRSTVFHYKGRETDPKKIGRELGVHALLSGTVVQQGITCGACRADRCARRQSHLGRALRSESVGSCCVATTDFA